MITGETYPFPETYEPLHAKVVHGSLVEQRDLDYLSQRQIADGVVRAVQIASVMMFLVNEGILTQDLERRSQETWVNLGTGSGADIVASWVMGAKSVGVDDLSMTSSFKIGAWCPIPQFTENAQYVRCNSQKYLDGLHASSVDVVTSFDTPPSVLTPGLNKGIMRVINHAGAFIGTTRTNGNSNEKFGSVPLGMQDVLQLKGDNIPIINTSDAIIEQWLPELSVCAGFRRFVESAFNPGVNLSRKADGIIVVWQAKSML